LIPQEFLEGAQRKKGDEEEEDHKFKNGKN